MYCTLGYTQVFVERKECWWQLLAAYILYAKSSLITFYVMITYKKLFSFHFCNASVRWSFVIVRDYFLLYALD